MPLVAPLAIPGQQHWLSLQDVDDVCAGAPCGTRLTSSRMRTGASLSSVMHSMRVSEAAERPSICRISSPSLRTPSSSPMAFEAGEFSVMLCTKTRRMVSELSAPPSKRSAIPRRSPGSL